MKKIIVRTFIIFLCVIGIFLISTSILYMMNKQNLGVEWQNIWNLENGEVVIKNTEKMMSNFAFIKTYNYLGKIIWTVLPLLYLKIGFVEYIEKKVRGSEVKRIFLRGLCYYITLSVFSFIITLPKYVFNSYIRRNIIYGYSNDLNELLVEFLKDSSRNFFMLLCVAIVVFYYYKTSKKWYIILWTMYVIATLIGSYFGFQIDKSEVGEVFNYSSEFKESTSRVKEKFNLENVEIKFITDDSEQTNINAYTVGFIDNTRIYIVQDTLSELNTMQFEALLAHEFAHCENNDVIKSIVINLTIDLIIVVISVAILSRIKKRDKRGTRELFIFLFIFNIVGIFLNPVKLLYSRYQELGADTRAMKVLESNEGNLSLEYKLIENTTFPVEVDNLYKWLFYTHPSSKERIENAKSFNK